MRQMDTVTKDKTFDEMMNRTKDLETTTESTVDLTTTTSSQESTRAQRGFIWEPKQSVKTEQKVEKPRRGGIFKKENILKYGLPRPTTGPRRGGIYKKL